MKKYGTKLIIKNYLAFCIDTMYSLFIWWFLFIVIIIWLDETMPGVAMNILDVMILPWMSVVSYFFIMSSNAMIQESLFNITLGKFIVGLVVTNDDYKKPLVRQILLRNLVDPIDTFFLIGSFPLVKGNGKTLGGYVSKTKLISKKELREKKCSLTL